MSLLQAVISSDSTPLKQEPPATIAQAWPLLLMLLVAFIGTTLAVWLVILFARYLRRNAFRKDAAPPAQAGEPTARR